MAKLEGVALEVFQNTEVVAIATTGKDGPHVIAVWGDYLRKLGLDGETLSFPVGAMIKTEANLKADPRVELICGTQAVKSERSLGRGCSIIGKGVMKSGGPELAHVKASFPWARAALVVSIEQVKIQL